MTTGRSHVTNPPYGQQGVKADCQSRQPSAFDHYFAKDAEAGQLRTDAQKTAEKAGEAGESLGNNPNVPPGTGEMAKERIKEQQDGLGRLKS